MIKKLLTVTFNHDFCAHRPGALLYLELWVPLPPISSGRNLLLSWWLHCSQWQPFLCRWVSLNIFVYSEGQQNVWLRLLFIVTGILLCHESFKLKSQSVFRCPDYDDCQIWGICDHLCEDRPGTHHCSCADGYFLEQGHICKANVSGMSHIIRHYIRYMFYICESNNMLSFSCVAHKKSS